MKTRNTLALGNRLIKLRGHSCKMVSESQKELKVAESAPQAANNSIICSRKDKCLLGYGLSETYLRYCFPLLCTALVVIGYYINCYTTLGHFTQCLDVAGGRQRSEYSYPEELLINESGISTVIQLNVKFEHLDSKKDAVLMPVI